MGMLRLPLILAYHEWFRRNEFTCDRAGLLCGQDPAAGESALARMAGFLRGHEDEFSIEELIAQTRAHEEVKNKLAAVQLALAALTATHPFTPERVKQLRDYAASEDYPRILSGNYTRDVMGHHELGARVKCPQCGTVVNAKVAFCPECGNDLSLARVQPQCVSCSEPLPDGVKYCPKCGTRQPSADKPVLAATTKLKNTMSSMFKKE
jgi:hypothetical protein